MDWIGSFFKKISSHAAFKNHGNSEIFRQGKAIRVLFFYPGEEGTYIENVDVTLFCNGMVHLISNQEESTTSIQNCEIVWSYDQLEEAAEEGNKIRLLKPVPPLQESPPL